MMFCQIPTPTNPELTSWIIGGAAVLTMASLVRTFIRKPPLEAEFVSKIELEKVRAELRGEIKEAQTELTNANVRIAHLEGLLSGANSRKLVKLVSLLFGLFFLSGCSTLLPSKRTESASLKSAEAIATTQNLTVEKIAHALTLSPEPFRIISTTEQTAGSTETAKGRYKISLPLGVTIGLVGLGLIALAWGIRAIRNSSAAANTAFTVMDSSLASGIRLLRNAATTSTDPTQISTYQTIIAGLESERGKALSRGGVGFRVPIHRVSTRAQI